MGKRKLSKKYNDLFEEKIIKRGKEYYNDKMVDMLYEYPDRYVATVYGSDNNYYNVIINLLEDNEIEMKCTCPYETNCKHEYATLMAIDDKEYGRNILLEIPDEEDVELIIKNIPKDKLVKYMCDFSFLLLYFHLLTIYMLLLVIHHLLFLIPYYLLHFIYIYYTNYLKNTIYFCRYYQTM